MKQESIVTLKAELLASFAEALEDNNTIGALGAILEHNAQRNIPDDGGAQKCTYKLKPSFCIDFTMPGSFNIKGVCEVETTDKHRGESEREFVTEGAVQQKLPLNAKPAKDGGDNE